MNLEDTEREMRRFYRYDPETRLGWAVIRYIDYMKAKLERIDITVVHNIGIDTADLHYVMLEEIRAGNYEDEDYIAFHMQESNNIDAQLDSEGDIVTIHWCYRSADEPGLFDRIRAALPDCWGWALSTRI